MAKATYTQVVDDIDGSPDAETVTFGFQGVAYSIDLSPKNLEKLTKAMAPFIERASKHRGTTRSGRNSNAKPDRPYSLPALREWAAQQHIDLPQRGRIPVAVVTQYQAAGGH